jgi:hypothetical protein
MIGYWLSILISDLLKYLILTAIIFPYLLITNSDYKYILAIMLLFILSSCIFTYCFSFLFDSEESGQKFFLLFTYMAGILLIIFTFVYYTDDLIKGKIRFYLHDIFPSSTMIAAVIRIWMALKNPASTTTITDIVNNYLVVFSVQILVYTIVLIFLDKRVIGYIYNKLLVKSTTNQNNFNNNLQNSNNYIRQEKEKVRNDNTLTFKIKDLTKVYRGCCSNTKAIDDVR